MATAKAPIDAALDRVITTELGEPVSYQISVTAYPTDSKMLLVNSPGSGELKDGREERWKKLALQLQRRGLYTMVTYNAPRPDFEVQLEWEPYSYKGASWNRLLIESLSHTIDWSLENAKGLCGSSAPVVNLVGFSSGGSAVGAVAHRYPQVQRMLLLSTYDSVGDQFYDGVYGFTGDICLVYGAEDATAALLAQVLGGGPLAARSYQAREVPRCGHRFDGDANTRMLSGAFLWAFGDPAGISSN